MTAVYAQSAASISDVPVDVADDEDEDEEDDEDEDDALSSCCVLIARVRSNRAICTSCELKSGTPLAPCEDEAGDGDAEADDDGAADEDDGSAVFLRWLRTADPPLAVCRCERAAPCDAEDEEDDDAATAATAAADAKRPPADRRNMFTNHDG